MSPPDAEGDSVEIDLKAIGLPPQKFNHAQSTRDGIYISESRMNPELKQEMLQHRLMKNNFIDGHAQGAGTTLSQFLSFNHDPSAFPD